MTEIGLMRDIALRTIAVLGDAGRMSRSARVPFYFSGTILLVVVFISLELMSNVRIALRPGDPTGIRGAS